jgi:hypothetical protein
MENIKKVPTFFIKPIFTYFFHKEVKKAIHHGEKMKKTQSKAVHF